MQHSELQRDALGTTHPPAGPDARIVSLVPSITELLCDLGLADRLVGRTGFCIHPAASVAAIAKVGGTKDVNVEKIRRLAPTHLIVNIDENEKPTVERLAEFVPHVVVTHPNAPRDNLALYRLLGGIFGAEDTAEELCAEFERRWAKLSPAPPRLRAVYCIWRDPWMCAGPDTYIGNMLAAIGVMLWTPDPATRYPAFAWEQARDADVVLLSSEPYRFTEEHAAELRAQLGKPVLLVDGEMLSWYGSRAVEGLSYLQQLSNKLS